jgi:putative ABC transport system substrate-binding protein
MRRIGVLAGTADEARMQARYEVFRQALAQLGWTDGRNMRIDYRWGETGGTDIIRKQAAELAALAPDVILVTGGVPGSDA